MARSGRFDTKNYWRRRTIQLASIGSLFRKAASEWRQDDALRLSAAVSFYAVLSLAPLLAIVIRVMGIAHASQFAREQILKQTKNLIGAQVADAIKPIINTTQSTGYLTTAVSTVVLLFSATGVFIELQNSLNSIWGLEFKAHKATHTHHAVLAFIRTRLLSLVMVLGLGLVLVLSIFISGIITAFQQRIAHVDHWPAYLAGIVISLIVEFTLFGAILKFLPAVHLRWKNIWHGALIAAILFSAGRFGLAI